MNRRINIFANIDWFTVLLYTIMVLMGWFNIYAAVYSEEHSSIFDFSQRYGKQMIWILAAFIIAIVVMLIDMNFYTLFAYPVYIFSLLLLIAVLLLGITVNASKSWLVFGPVHLQPAEFAKFATLLTLSRFLSASKQSVKNGKIMLISFVIILIPVIFIMLQPDVGSALVYASFIFVLFRQGLPKWGLSLAVFMPVLMIIALVWDDLMVMWVLLAFAIFLYHSLGGTIKTTFYLLLALLLVNLSLFFLDKKEWLPYDLYLISLLCMAGISLLGIFVALFRRAYYIFLVIILFFGSIGFAHSVDYFVDEVLMDHQRNRIYTMLDPESDPHGYGYNITQSKIAIGSGGWTGKGFLEGTQTKFDFVPEQSTDFIFCTIGEEWGFLGSFFVVMLFAVLMLRIIYIAERQRLRIARIFGYGVVSIFFLHFFVNIGMTIGLFPIIGIPLPFFSYGGSSLWSFTIMLFVLLNYDARRLEVMR